jgi:hypothetical protein
VVGPAARLPGRVHVGAAEEVGLHVHLLDGQLPRLDAVAHPLVARVEAAGVTDHAGQAGLLLHALHLLRVGPAVGDRDLHLDVLARPHRRDRLGGVQLGRRAQDDRVHVVPREHHVKVRAGVPDAVLARDLLGLLQAAADHGGDGDTVDVRQAVEVLDAERAGAGEGNPHVQSLLGYAGVSTERSTRCPTAVLEPGTW